MNFGQAILTCLRKYAIFQGRAARPEYWWFFLFEILLMAAASRVSETLSGLISLALLLPALAVGVRRLHDIGKSGWWLLLSLVPILGWIVLLVWAVQKSDAQANVYGAPSLAEAAASLPPGAA